MIYEKPKNEIFASDAKDGEIVEFPNIKRGWGVTENLGFIPPMEYFNAAFNRVDKSIAYQLQRGVAEWDKDLEYPIGAVVSLNKVVYVAKSQNINKNPANEATIWNIVATQKWCEDSFLKKTDDKFALKDDLPSLATETKVGLVKIKNIIDAKQTDVAVTEKAVSEFVAASQSGLGIDQTWQDVKDQRQAGVTYTNTTGRPIMVCIQATMNYGVATCPIFVDGIKVGEVLEHHTVNKVDHVTFIVPNGSTYKADLTIGVHSILIWSELR